MKKILSIIIALQTSFLIIQEVKAQIINVPADQPTIQAGINAAVNGDTVLVQPGNYIEDIDYNGKNITVASLFLTTQNTVYISQTIIDGGGNYIGNGLVKIRNGEDSTALLCGFTITNGKAYKGGGINCENSNPRLRNLKITGNTAWLGGGIALDNSCAVIQDVIICSNSALNDDPGGSCNPEADGGGIYCSNSNPVIINTTISKNWVSSLTGGPVRGGGICFWTSTGIMINVKIMYNFVEPGYYYDGIGGGIFGGDSLYLSNVTITGNSANIGGGVASANMVFDSVSRCDIYLNHANQGNDLYSNSTAITEVILDTFTVFSPTEFFASPIEKFSFDIFHGYTEIIETEADLFVSPDGDNSNSGLTQNEPLQNIGHALAKIQADSLHPHTIYLLEGTYSKSVNGETFPLYLTDYIALSGVSPDGITLDAEGHSILAVVNTRNGVRITDLTMQGGLGGRCGSLFCKQTDLDLENVKLLNNIAVVLGGVVDLFQSSPAITNCLIAENQGFGIFCNESNPHLTNITISNNDTLSGYYQGGAIYCKERSHPIVVNSILWHDLTDEIVFATWFSDTSAVTVHHTDLQDGEEGINTGNNGTVYWLEGNINQYPLFTGTGNDPYTLSDDSPCINAGTPDTTGLNLPPFDLAGNPRIFGGRIDMGAYENQNVATFINPVLPAQDFEFLCTPNPFSGELTIAYTLSESAYTIIEIYNSEGKKVKELSHKFQSEGRQVWQIRTNDLPAGVYYCILINTNERIQTRKIIKL